MIFKLMSLEILLEASNCGTRISDDVLMWNIVVSTVIFLHFCHKIEELLLKFWVSHEFLLRSM